MREGTLAHAFVALLLVIANVNESNANDSHSPWLGGSSFAFRVRHVDGVHCMSHAGYFLRQKSCDGNNDVASSAQLFELTSLGFLKRASNGACLNIRGVPGRRWNAARMVNCGWAEGVPQMYFQLPLASGGGDGGVRQVRASDGLCLVVDRSRQIKTHTDCEVRGAVWRVEMIGDVGGGGAAMVSSSAVVAAAAVPRLPRVQITAFGSQQRCLNTKGFYASVGSCEAGEADVNMFELSARGMLVRTSDGKCVRVLGHDRNWATLAMAKCTGLPDQLFYLADFEKRGVAPFSLRNARGRNRCLVVAMFGFVKTNECSLRSSDLWSVRLVDSVPQRTGT